MPNEIDKLKKELEEAKATLKLKDQKITDLTSEKTAIQEKLNILQKERPKLKPEDLALSFKSALKKMAEGLKTEEGQIDYRVGKFDVDLKTNVTLDESGNINFQLPYLEDIIPAENLSILHMSFVSIPKARVIPEETVEVPNLVGMSKGAGIETLKKLNLKPGKIEERKSLSPAYTIIEQNPEPYSIVPTNSEINLVVSQLSEVKVPKLVGIKKDMAIKTIKQSKLKVGKITKEISDSAPDTVISQSIMADTVVPLETPIDIVIATPEMIEVPEVKGKNLREASEIIRKSKLKVGRIVERISKQPKSTVIGQSPLPGTKVPKGSDLDLRVAKGGA
jgi:hypothetical protein